jgi:sugar (pentulose or hexulose) kinase
MNGDAGMNGCVAVFDVGKTNMKVVVFDAAGEVVAERSAPNAPLPPDGQWPYLRLDTEGAWSFLIGALKEFGARFSIEAISTTTHGCAGVLMQRDGVAVPPLDYEFDGFAAVDAAYDTARPPYDETRSPHLPRGLNLGRHIFYFERHFPTQFKQAAAFLTYPQYFAWRLAGAMASEATSLGAHTDLWRPKEGDLSSMVNKLGWRRLFPPMRKAWDTLGTLRPEIAAETGLPPIVRIVCGAHDSNASLVPHLLSRRDPFTVISTGTWVIIMAVGGTARLDPKADMLANVDVRGEPVPTARFMGGREFTVLAGDGPADADEADVAGVIASGVMALPAFSDQGGPFGARKGRIEGGTPAAPEARTALATLYAALVTAHVIERLEAPGDLIVEGGFARSPTFAAVLARLMASRRVVVAPMSAGAAAGAAMLARWSEPHPPPRLEPARAWDLPGLEAYQDRWERAL